MEVRFPPEVEVPRFQRRWFLEVLASRPTVILDRPLIAKLFEGGEYQVGFLVRRLLKRELSR